MKDYFGAFGLGMAWNSLIGAFLFAPDRLFPVALMGGIVFVMLE